MPKLINVFIAIGCLLNCSYN